MPTPSVLCPRCAGPVLALPEFAGQAIGCPHCNQPFLQPAAPQQGALAVPPAPREQPVIIVRERETPATERLQPMGWFSRGLSVTAGILTAIVLVLGLLVGTALFLTYSSVKAGLDDEIAERDRVLRGMLPTLKNFGVEKLAHETRVRRGGGGLYFVEGIGRSLRGEMHEVDAEVRVVHFDDFIRIEVEYLSIDGEVCKLKSE